MPSCYGAHLSRWRTKTRRHYMKREYKIIMSDQDDIFLRARFTSFLTVVVKNAQIDYVRKNSKNNKIIFLQTIPECAVSFDEQYNHIISNSDFEFEEEKLAAAFQELPLLKQQILKYTFYEQLSASEIAARLNCSTGYVYLQKHRALKKLRDVLLMGRN